MNRLYFKLETDLAARSPHARGLSLYFKFGIPKGLELDCELGQGDNGSRLWSARLPDNLGAKFRIRGGERRRWVRYRPFSHITKILP